MLHGGQTIQFTLFYGAAANESAAMAALTAVGADVYSIAEANTPDGPTLGTPNTFILGIKGVPYNPPSSPSGPSGAGSPTPGDVGGVGRSM